MKKATLLLLTVLAFNLSNAQTEGTVSMFQNVDSNYFDVLVEADLTASNNLNFSFAGTFTKGTNNKKVNAGIGYSLRDEKVNLTPSLVIGSNVGESNDIFYGLDADIDISLLKWLKLSGKYRYLKDNEFTASYYVGLKISL